MALAQGGLTLLLLAAAGCGGAKTVTLTVTHTTTRTVTAPTATANGNATTMCAATDLGGVFRVVNGSAGAGQISYALVLTNTSQHDCIVTGMPTVQLVDAHGDDLATHEEPASPGQSTAALITLHPGDSASAQARFSPDVAGTGDSQSPGSPCQPKASTLRVQANGGGTLDAPIQPPTSVCEQGTLRFELLSAS
ncbi:MAG TPA: DUF4232 domain-containing protein [Gaiellaceae bacterium]|nr:DUF4232 domain-containing protein [Gaiellaceae bacterium]